MRRAHTETNWTRLGGGRLCRESEGNRIGQAHRSISFFEVGCVVGCIVGLIPIIENATA
jgi:hypothetical protein